MYKVGDAVYFIEGLQIKTAVVLEAHECYVLLYKPQEDCMTSRLNGNVSRNLRRMQKRLVKVSAQKRALRRALEVERSEEMTPEQMMRLLNIGHSTNLKNKDGWF